MNFDWNDPEDRQYFWTIVGGILTVIGAVLQCVGAFLSP